MLRKPFHGYGRKCVCVGGGGRKEILKCRLSSTQLYISVVCVALSELCTQLSNSTITKLCQN